MFVPENISKARVSGAGKGSAFSDGVTMGPSHAPEGDKDFEYVMETGEREQNSKEQWADVAQQGEKAQKSGAASNRSVHHKASNGSDVGSNALASTGTPGQKSSLFELSRSSNKAVKGTNRAENAAAPIKFSSKATSDEGVDTIAEVETLSLSEEQEQPYSAITLGAKEPKHSPGQSALKVSVEGSSQLHKGIENGAAAPIKLSAEPISKQVTSAGERRDMVAEVQVETEHSEQPYSAVTLGAQEPKHSPGRSALKISVEGSSQLDKGIENGVSKPLQDRVYNVPEKDNLSNIPSSSGTGTSDRGKGNLSTNMSIAAEGMVTQPGHVGQEELQEIAKNRTTPPPSKKTTHTSSGASSVLSEHHPAAMTVNSKAGIQVQPQSGFALKSTKPGTGQQTPSTTGEAAGKVSETPKSPSNTTYILPKDTEVFIAANDEAEALPSSMMSGMEQEHEKLSFGVAPQIMAMTPEKVQNQAQVQSQMHHNSGQSQGPSASAMFWGQSEHGSEAGKVQSSSPLPAKASTAELMGKSQNSGAHQQDSGSNERNFTRNKVVAAAPLSTGTVKITQSAKLPSGEVVETFSTEETQYSENLTPQISPSSAAAARTAAEARQSVIGAAEGEFVKPLSVKTNLAASKTAVSIEPKEETKTVRHIPIELRKEAGNESATISTASKSMPTSQRKGVVGNFIDDEVIPDVNLLMAEQVPPRYVTVEKSSETPSVSRVSELQAIVDRLVKSIQQLEVAGKTDTVIELKDQGVFSGSRITITEFNSSKKQLNITIDNLTQQSKMLIDLPENRTALLHVLSERGYTIQMMVTTTAFVDNSPILSDAKGQEQEKPRGSSSSSDREQQQQQRREQRPFE